MQKKYGGSLASASVSSLIDGAMYSKMNNAFSDVFEGGASCTKKTRCPKVTPGTKETKRTVPPKGGSIASNTVASKVSPMTFSKMNSGMSNIIGGKSRNKQTAGSPSSNAVTSLVSKGAYSKMNSGMSNITGGKKQPPSRGGNSVWNRVIDDFAQNFTHHGGRGEFQNLEFYRNGEKGTNVYNNKFSKGGGRRSVKNGGSSNTGCGESSSAKMNSIGLDYSGIKHFSASTADSGYSQSAKSAALDVFTSIDDYNIGLHKTVHYGINDSSAATPFRYSGGNKCMASGCKCQKCQKRAKNAKKEPKM
jgi:hypothetical protein